MKRLGNFLGLVLLVIILFLTANVSAQTGAVSGTRFGIGQDSINCARALTLYDQDFRQRNYDAAIANWRILWRDCPQSSVNLTPRGADMYRHYISRELNQDRRSALVDTLLSVWERGIELRPQARANYQIQLLQDMLRFADTPENQPRIMSLLENIMETQKEQTTANVYANYMRIIFSQHREMMLSDEELLDNYNTVNDAISYAIVHTSDEKMGEELARARDQFDETFANSTAATCENLITIYGEKYEDNKNDAEFLRKVTSMLTRKECTDAELFEMATEQQYALNPSAAAAYSMGMLFFRRDNIERAIEYFEEAIRQETNPFDKARYNYLLAGIMLSKYNRFTDARRYTLEAIRLRPDWGMPYILLANIYVSGPRCGEEAFEQSYVYLVAVDKLQTARRVDTDVARTADELIRTFSRHFPRSEEAFFRGISEGATVRVGCWINEGTTIRFAQ